MNASAKPAVEPASLLDAPRPLGAIPLYRSTVDLPRLVSSTLEPLQCEASGRDITLSIDAPSGGVPVVVDPEKIAWAIATLVGNALRYVRRGTVRLPGGSIVVRIRRTEAGRAVTIEVEDDGPGIGPEKLTQLFERAPGTQHATGLGLRLIHEIFAAHGGSVEVESSTKYTSHGTRVRLTLP